MQDDLQPVATARGMLHVPLPEPQQTAPLVNTTQAHVVQQTVPVQSSTCEISSLVHNTSSNQDEPLFILGLTNEYNMFISQSLKEIIWNFEYIDLYLLLKQNFVHNTQEYQNILQIIDGKLVVQSKSKKVKSIDSIKMWMEAFITYIQVVIDNHPNKAYKLLKYLSVIRDASHECPTVQWVQYDQQFRLRVSRNPTRSWSNIDAELWPRFIAKGSHGQNTGQSRLSKYPCYDYNLQ